ncbi:MAG: glycosyltransferase family 4 protein [Anaerolineae bacterium]|nr:glycosyltransferase family 4 protein [Anaerolineae bacterium]
MTNSQLLTGQWQKFKAFVVALFSVLQPRSNRLDEVSDHQPVKVLHIITRLIIGGAQETAMLIADYIDDKVWAVDVLSGPQTGSEGSLIEEVRRRGVPLIIEPNLVREVHPLKDFIALVRLTQHIRQNHYTIVHTHSSKAGILGRWAAWLAGTPLIVHTVHGWAHHEQQHPLVRGIYILLEKLTLPITSQLIVVSPRNIEKGVKDRIGQPENYVVIRSGIELDRFGRPQVPPTQMRMALSIPIDAPVVGTVTRLSDQKAPLDFVQAAGIIAQEVPEAWFVMVGDGPLRSEVETLVEKLDLADRLILTGLRRDVPELMATFDLFVLSSLWEGLPRVLPQAMATGLPIVATAVDGNAEAVMDGVNGRLVPPGKPQQLAQTIIELLRNPSLMTSMGQAGREMVDEFGAQRMVEQLAELYKQLLHKKVSDKYPHQFSSNG